MTEAEWVACDQPHRMLQHLRPWKRRGRKLCLYACASYRRPNIWVHLDESCRTLLDVAERHADGLTGRAEYRAAMRVVSKAAKLAKLAGGANGPPLWGQALLDILRLGRLPGWAGATPTVARFDYLSEAARRNRAEMRSRGVDVITEVQAVAVQQEQDAFMADHTNFLRDLFGNPFRPVVLAPDLRTPLVVSLAQAAYAERHLPSGHLDAERLRILADALEDAGCRDAALLEHLRAPGPHVRGCHVVDLLLGQQ